MEIGETGVTKKGERWCEEVGRGGEVEEGERRGAIHGEWS